ncbi:MAG TPA: zinc ABC transporter substrate-binding protein [Burkholderiales bacterium]|nr:zinc ABC transporter substrate-binding protein [Burkholderiales bacterium]
MKRFIALLAACTALAAAPARGALNVLACEPEWASLVQELAGDRARVVSATTARQDPHRIEARPALLAQARRADLLVCTGADLEIGWLPLLQREAGNAGIQPGQPGYFEAARFVDLGEKPARVDRSMGDVHAAGNPHIHLDPRNLLKVAEALSARLAALDARNAGDYAARHRDFSARMQAAIARWERDAASLKGMRVLAHHRNWTYLAEWLQLRVVADLEPKPGIEPSAAYLAQLLEKLKAQPAKMVLRTPYQPPRASEWIAERAGMRAVELPFTVGGSAAAKDLFSLFEDTLVRLKDAAQ